MRASLGMSLCSLAAFAALLFAAPAKATTITLIGSSAAYTGYDASNATDTGSNYLVTDFAGNGTGVNTYLDFALTGGASHIDVYDRTTSGGGNGTYYGGTTDFTTKFELLFSNSVDSSGHADFSNPIATDVFTKTAPTNPTGQGSFLYSADFDQVNALYVRYQVLETNVPGSNPGVANIALSNPAATPEPSSLMLLGSGILGVAGIARRRISRKA